MDRKSMPPRRGKPGELAAWAERERPREIGAPEWEALQRLLAPISESRLRRILRDSGIALTPLVEGVRQQSFEALEMSLLSLLGEYQKADSQRRLAVRRLVIAARDHARWASRKDSQRAEKSEMILWMSTWLLNPPVFPEWVRLRRIAMAGNEET
jgi:hypothetical protein